MGTLKLADLTPAQLKTLDSSDRLQRSAVLALQEALNLCNAAQLDYNEAELPVINLLDGTELLPTTTGLDGAQPFAQIDPGYLTNYLGLFTAWYAANLADSTHQDMFVKAIGALNMQATS